MANANTFAEAVGTPASAQVINSTTETVLGASAPLTVGLSNQGNFDAGRPFIVRLRGIIKGGTTTTGTLKLYIGTSATVGSDTLVTATSAVNVLAAGGHFNVSVELQWDSVLQTVQGTMGGHLNGTAQTGAITGSPASIASVAALQFVASATFSAANATNSVAVTEFIIDQA